MRPGTPNPLEGVRHALLGAKAKPGAAPCHSPSLRSVGCSGSGLQCRLSYQDIGGITAPPEVRGEGQAQAGVAHA